MTKLHRVLAAVDFSEPARAAFDHALALSRLHDAELMVVHAVPTETVAREAAQPVLVVPAAAGKVGDSTTPFKNILVAVDLGEGSSAAVERALSMANGDSRVTVVHVVRGVPFERSYRYPYHLMEPEYQRNLARVAWRRIATMVPADATTSRRVHTRVVTGEPTAEISRVAAEVNADLILVGVTARGLIGRLIMGSTAARVIRMAGRPVLAIPQPVSKAAASLHQDQLPVAA